MQVAAFPCERRRQSGVAIATKSEKMVSRSTESGVVSASCSAAIISCSAEQTASSSWCCCHSWGE